MTLTHVNIPIQFFTELRMGRTELAILSLAYSFRDTGGLKLSNNKLAKALNVHRGTVINAINNLRNEGYLTGDHSQKRILMTNGKVEKLLVAQTRPVVEEGSRANDTSKAKTGRANDTKLVAQARPINKEGKFNIESAYKEFYKTSLIRKGFDKGFIAYKGIVEKSDNPEKCAANMLAKVKTELASGALQPDSKFVYPATWLKDQVFEDEQPARDPMTKANVREYGKNPSWEIPANWSIADKQAVRAIRESIAKCGK